MSALGKPLALTELEAVRNGLQDYESLRFNATDEAQPAELKDYLDFYGINVARDSRNYPRLRHGVHALTSGSYRLCLHTFKQANASKTLLLVHGYLDHVGLFGHLIRYGLERGYNVVAFDLPGHGLSSGEAAVIDNFADYSEAIKSVVRVCGDFPQDWSLIAQSTGAAAVFDYFLRYDAAPFKRAVLLAPLIRPVGWWWIRAARPLLRPFCKDVTRRFARNSSDAEFLAFIQNDPLQQRRLPLRWMAALGSWLKSLPQKNNAPIPMLVIQGDADTTVDWRYNIECIQRIFAGADTRIVVGARHHLANESQVYQSEIRGLIDEFLMRR